MQEDDAIETTVELPKPEARVVAGSAKKRGRPANADMPVKARLANKQHIGRPYFTGEFKADMEIRLYAKLVGASSPYKKGTKRDKVYALYSKEGLTVLKFVQSGGTLTDLHRDVRAKRVIVK